MTNKKYPRSFAHACAMTKKNPKTALPYAKPKNDFQEALNAVATLWIIAQAIRGTWEADYDNSNQKKWYPWFRKTASGFVFSNAFCDWSFSYSATGSRLCFENSEDAEYFGKKFIKLHNKVLLISKK